MEVNTWTQSRLRSSIKPNSLSTTCSLHGCHEEHHDDASHYMTTPVRQVQAANYRDQASMPDVKPDYFGSSYSKQRNLRRSSKEHLRGTPSRQSRPDELAERAESALNDTAKTIEYAMEVIDRSAALERRTLNGDSFSRTYQPLTSSSKEIIEKRLRFCIPEEVAQREGNGRGRELITELRIDQRRPSGSSTYKTVDIIKDKYTEKYSDKFRSVRGRNESEFDLAPAGRVYPRSTQNRQQVHTGTLRTDLTGSSKKLTDFRSGFKYEHDSGVVADESIIPSKSDARAHLNPMISHDTIDRLSHSILKRPIDLSSLVSIKQDKRNPAATTKATTFSLFKQGTALNRKDSKAEKDSEYKKLYLNENSPSKPELYTETTVCQTREVSQRPDRDVETVIDERRTSYQARREPDRCAVQPARLLRTQIPIQARDQYPSRIARETNQKSDHGQSSIIRRASRWDPSSVAQSIRIDDQNRVDLEMLIPGSECRDESINAAVVNGSGDVLWRGMLSSERTRDQKARGRDQVELEMSELRKKYIPVDQRQEGSLERVDKSTVNDISRERSAQRQRSAERLGGKGRLNQSYNVLGDSSDDCERISHCSYQPKLIYSKAKDMNSSLLEKSNSRLGLTTNSKLAESDPFEDLRAISNNKYKTDVEKKLNFDSASKDQNINSFSFQNGTPAKNFKRSSANQPTTAEATMQIQDEAISFGNNGSRRQASSRPGSSFNSAVQEPVLERDLFSEEKLITSASKSKNIDVIWRDQRDNSLHKIATPDNMNYSPRQALPVCDPIFKADHIESRKWCKYHGNHDVITEPFVSRLNDGRVRRATPEKTNRCTMRGISNQSQRSFNNKMLGRHYKGLVNAEGSKTSLNRSTVLEYSHVQRNHLNKSYDDVKIVILDEDRQRDKNFDSKGFRPKRRDIPESILLEERLLQDKASRNRLSMHTPNKGLKSCLKPSLQSKLKNYNPDQIMRSTLKY